MSEFKNQLLLAADVDPLRIIEFSCGDCFVFLLAVMIRSIYWGGVFVCRSCDSRKSYTSYLSMQGPGRLGV